MPKIMYRPNPTPPPFVPPVPPAPTGPYVTMSPFPFELNTPLVCNICNVVVPANATTMMLIIKDNGIPIVFQSQSIESPIIGDFSISTISGGSSSSNLQGTINFSDTEGLIDTVQLIVYQP